MAHSVIEEWPPASPSCRLYEPEAVGAIGAYAPEGRWELGMWNVE